jgi:hypothetical protein
MVSFTDSKNRTWFPRVTLAAIRNLELRRGVNFWEIAYELAGEWATNKDNSIESLMPFIQKLLGSIDATEQFLYDALRDSFNSVTFDGKLVTLEDFREGFTLENFLPAQVTAMMAIIESLPKADSTETEPTEKKSDHDKSNLGGEKSTGSPENAG